VLIKTKARSKAARRASRRGRPRLPANNREPNGKPSRRKNAYEGRIMDVAINRRIRQQGILGSSDEPLEKQAADPRRGYVLGILLLGDRIRQAQHDAGLRYGADMSRFYKLNGIAFPSVRAQNLFSVHGEAGEENARQALDAAAAYKRMRQLRETLHAVGDIDTGRRVEQTVRAVCLLDLPGSDSNGQSFRSDLLIRGLNVLARYYGLVDAEDDRQESAGNLTVKASAN
jgi:hypothetical protein